MSEATIATGTYVIENVDRRNDVFLADDGRALVAGSSDADAHPPSESCWKLTRLRNGQYLIRHAEQQNRYACWPVGFCQGSEIVTSPTPHHWVVTEAKVKETYVISHARCQLYWGIEDDEEGRPVRLRYPPTGSGNQWKFHRLSPTTVTPPIAIESQNINGNVDGVTVPPPSQPRELDDARPFTSTPVVAQNVDRTLAIDGSEIDSEMETTTIPIQTSKVVAGGSTSVVPQNVIESPNIDESPDCQTKIIPTRSQARGVDDDQPASSIPVIPQSVVGSVAINGSKVDSQTATIQNQSRASELVDDRPARSTSAVPQSVIESPTIAETLDNQAPAIPTRDLLREEVDSRQATPTPVVPQSVVESRTVVDGHTTSTPSETRSAKDDRPAIRHILEGHASDVFSVAYSPDGKQIVSGSGDKTVCVWDVPTRCLALKPMEGHTRWVLSVAFSPDGKRIVSGSIDPTVRIWDAQSGTLARTLNHPDWVRSVACSSDGKRVVSGCDDRAVRVWDVETGSLILGPLLGHTGWVYTVKFSPDGKQFLSGSYDSTVRVWDADTGHAIRTFRGESSIRSAMFSPDSKQIVSGDESYMVTVWDMQSGDSITLQGHQGTVFSVWFSPDGERIVSGGSGGQIIVWDAKFGKALGRLEGHTDIVTSVAFSPDGKWIVSGSQDNTVRIWEADRLDAMPDVE